MSNSAETIPIKQTSNHQSKWFDDFIATIKSHELMLETDTASKELKDLYNAVFADDAMKVAVLSREISTMSIVKILVIEYLSHLGEATNKAISVSFSFSAERILVWVVIPNDREDVEDEFWIAQMKVNGEHGDKGVFISATIMEERDNVSLPSHYHTFTSKTN
ncbi:MAG: hypothetical protein ACPGVB_04230 [Chitinophagales bacterium]